MNITLIMTISLLLTITFLPVVNFADATKASGTSPSRIGVEICGDRLCEEGEHMDTKEKLGYYLLSLIEFDDTTVIPQGRFSVEGVSQQSLGFNPGMDEINIGSFPTKSIIDKGAINAMAIPIAQPKFQLGVSSPLVSPFPASPQNDSTIIAHSQKIEPTITINKLNVGNLGIDKFVNFVDKTKIVTGSIDKDALLTASNFDPFVIHSKEDFQRLRAATLDYKIDYSVNPNQILQNMEYEPRSAGTFEYTVDIPSAYLVPDTTFTITRQEHTPVFIDEEYKTISPSDIDKEFLVDMRGQTLKVFEIKSDYLIEKIERGSVPGANQGDVVMFHVIGDNSGQYHTFHLHGHKWLNPGTLDIIDTILMKSNSHSLSQPYTFVIRAGEGVGPGNWHMHCHVVDHMMSMYTTFKVNEI